MSRKAGHDAIQERFLDLMPDEVMKAKEWALTDLYSGPGSNEDGALGFESACKVVKAWADDNVCEVWYEAMFDHVSDSDPSNGYADNGEPIDYDMSSTYHYDISDVKAILFGRELARYV